MDRVIREAERNLSAAIERLYVVFALYPLDPDMDACLCGCISADDKRRLYSKPLRLLSADDLWKYASKAMTTWGDEADLKHFLPRVFQLLVNSPDELPDVEVLFGKLTLANWQDWPRVEQQAVLDFLRALWSCLIVAPGSDGHGTDVDPYICAIGQTVDDLRPFLQVWQDTGHGVATANLAEFVNNNAPVINDRHKLANAFWSGRRAQMQQVLDWVLDPVTLRALEEKALAHIDDDLFAPLAAAVDALRLVQ
jgi:hypothetical protein